MKSVGFALSLWFKTTKCKPIAYWTVLEFWFILPRANADCHNYFKTVLDTMEQAGIVTDDRYVLPRVMGIAFDSKAPAIIVKIPMV